MNTNNNNEKSSVSQSLDDQSISLTLNKNDIEVFSVVVLIIIVFCLHKYIVKLIDKIISIPIYRRLTPISIGLISTFATGGLSKSLAITTSIVCYLITFAFNEYYVKKEVQKEKSPLEDKITEKDSLIENFRAVIEDKKNKFQQQIIVKIDKCLRVNSKNDTEDLSKIRAELGRLQDFILAEKTFLETPDEALRRIENSKSGNKEMAMETMVGNSNLN